ncbi:MAG: bacteriocin [Solobacterium sp.]|nr:bacteriocin [Solobacterium sp.]
MRKHYGMMKKHVIELNNSELEQIIGGVFCD